MFFPYTTCFCAEGPWPTFCGTGKRWPQSTGPSLETDGACRHGEKPWIFATENDLKWWPVIVWWCLIHIYIYSFYDVLWYFMIFYELMPKKKDQTPSLETWHQPMTPGALAPIMVCRVALQMDYKYWNNSSQFFESNYFYIWRDIEPSKRNTMPKFYICPPKPRNDGEFSVGFAHDHTGRWSPPFFKIISNTSQYSQCRHEFTQYSPDISQHYIARWWCTSYICWIPRHPSDETVLAVASADVAQLNWGYLGKPQIWSRFSTAVTNNWSHC